VLASLSNWGTGAAATSATEKSSASMAEQVRRQSRRRPPIRHKRASGACSLRASALIEAVVRAGRRCPSQGGDDRHRPPNRALLLSPNLSSATAIRGVIPFDGIQSPGQLEAGDRVGDGGLAGAARSRTSASTRARSSSRTRFRVRTCLSAQPPAVSLCAARATLRPAAFAISWLAPGPRRARVPRDAGPSAPLLRDAQCRRTRARNGADRSLTGPALRETRCDGSAPRRRPSHRPTLRRPFRALQG
jgi:hypothetical protein